MFRAADSFAIKLSLVMHHHKLVLGLDYSVQGQGHSGGSKTDLMHVSLICCVPLVPLQPNYACTVTNSQT